MTIQEQNKTIVLRFNKEFIEKGNMDVLQEIIAPDFVNQSAPEAVAKGPEGVLYFFNHIIRTAFADLKVDIYDQLADGDKVVTRKAFVATHKDDFMGFHPSYKKVVVNIIDIIRLKDGKFIEHWNVMDLEDVMMKSNALDSVF